MAENNQVTKTTLEDLKRFNQLIVGSSVRNLRILKEQVERRIVIYERRLIELYNNEHMVKARINNNADAITIANKYAAGIDTQVEPIQSFKYQNVDPRPHRSYAYNKFTISQTQQGITILDAELNRINNEIQMIQAQLREYEKVKKDIDDKLWEAEEREKTNLYDKTYGRVIPPTKADLAKEKIAQARIANILLLQGIAKTYENYTTKEGKVGYPDENMLPKDLQILRQLFWAHAQSESLVYREGTSEEPLYTVLNFDNPGDTNNIEILNSIVSAERATGLNTKTDIQVDRFIRDVISTANDPLISRGIERKSDVPLALANSVREQTKSYPVAVGRLGDFYLGSFELPSITDSIRKWWKKRNEKLYKGLPTCPNIDKSELETSTDRKELITQAATEAMRRAGEEKYRDSLRVAQNFIDEQIEARVGDLPEDAPEWVSAYLKLHGDARRGFITYQGQQNIVLRGTGDEPGEAILDAESILYSDITLIEDYTYKSLLGYQITYKNNKTVLVSSKDNIDTKSVKSIEDVYQYIGFVLYASE